MTFIKTKFLLKLPFNNHQKGKKLTTSLQSWNALPKALSND